MLEVEHLSAELVGFGVDEDELIGKVLGEDGLGYGHADVVDSDDGDLDVASGGEGGADLNLCPLPYNYHIFCNEKTNSHIKVKKWKIPIFLGSKHKIPYGT